jgi:predicted porin
VGRGEDREGGSSKLNNLPPRIVERRKWTGQKMKYLAVALLSSAVGIAWTGAQAADLPTTKPASAPAGTPCFESLYAYMDSTPKDCPLSWWGITVYGVIDMGYGYSSHGANFNGAYPQGVAELIAKYSQGSKWQFVPNGLQRSNVGIKAKEEFAPGWTFVGNVNTDFDPYSLHLANGPESLVENNNKTIGNQSANSDSSRAGQWDNTQGYVGVSNSTYGTLTVGRLNSFSIDAVTSYDAMQGSYAFSLIGNSATYVSGVGDTETTRYESAVKYFVAYNNFRAGALWQFGGYSLGNGSDGAYQFDVGADYAGFSFDAIYSYARDAVSLSSYSANPLPAGVTQNDLKATLADISGAIFAGKYTYQQVTVYGGYEYAVFMPPSDTYAGGFTSLGGYTVLPSGVNSTAYIDNKHLQVAWVGAKYAVRSDLDVAGAYYIAHQNDYAPPGSKPTVCGPNTVAAIPGASPQGSLNTYCAGNLQAVSALIDYRPLKRLDLYAGILYSIASGGIASGYIHSNNFAPTVGLRLSF